MNTKNYMDRQSMIKRKEDSKEVSDAFFEQSTTLEMDAPIYIDTTGKKKKGLSMIVILPIALLTFFLGMFIERQRIVKNKEVDEQHFVMDEEQLDKVREETEKETMDKFYDMVKEYGQETQVNVKFMRKMFPDKMVLKSDGCFWYLDIDESIEKNRYDYSKMQKEGQFFVYTDEEQGIVSKKGIDVSKFQGKIDWKLVKKDGIEFAILRVGFRGYESGKLVLDETFINNLEGTKEQNIDIGVYFYSQAITREEAIEEAQMVIDAIKDYNITYPVVLDTEIPSGDGARTEGLTNEERTEYIQVFCETVEKAGYKPMVYSNVNWFILQTDYKELSKYDIWLANYDSQPYFPYDFQMWQYSDKGKINGIEGDVDLNICFKDYTND